jgi:hypothetical protein
MQAAASWVHPTVHCRSRSRASKGCRWLCNLRRTDCIHKKHSRRNKLEPDFTGLT